MLHKERTPDMKCSKSSKQAAVTCCYSFFHKMTELHFSEENHHACSTPTTIQLHEKPSQLHSPSPRSRRFCRLRGPPGGTRKGSSIRHSTFHLSLSKTISKRDGSGRFCYMRQGEKRENGLEVEDCFHTAMCLGLSTNCSSGRMLHPSRNFLQRMRDTWCVSGLSSHDRFTPHLPLVLHVSTLPRRNTAQRREQLQM